MVKCRVSYGETLGPVEFSKYTKKTINSLQQVECESFDYSLKYQDRSKLEHLFRYRGTCDEVLITIQGIITDTSYSNVVLYDGNSWYTPETPLLEGTQRALLLDAGRIRTAKIQINELGDFPKLVLINAMVEFEPEHFVPITHIDLWNRKPVSFDPN
jgi:4-amino-4-deoxychorismate lyase